MFEREPDKETTRHYIDTLSSTASRRARIGLRLTLTGFALSLILIALSSGLISAAEGGAVKVQGVELQASLAVLLAVTSVLISVFVGFGYWLIAATQIIRNEIRRLYRSIGFEDETLDDPRIFPPSAPPTSVTVNTGAFMRYVLASFVIGLPMTAQVAAGFQLSELLQQTRLGPIGYLFVLLAFSTGYTILAITRLMNYRMRSTPVSKIRLSLADVISASVYVVIFMLLPFGALGFFIALLAP
jgi:hypothetical protein